MKREDAEHEEQSGWIMMEPVYCSIVVGPDDGKKIRRTVSQVSKLTTSRIGESPLANRRYFVSINAKESKESKLDCAAGAG